MWFMGDFVGDAKNWKKKTDFKKVKYCVEAYHCLLSKNAWFRFFQRSGAQICVKHQMSLWGVLEGWANRDSWVILGKSQKKALEKLEQGKGRILKPTLSSLRGCFS